MVDLFYKGYINIKEHYTAIKGKRVDFGLDAINELYRLDNNEIGHVVFKNRKDRDLQEALEKVTWPWTKWDRTPTGKYQLFPHNFTTKQVCG
uniref:Uncharacterized protein n=1 Tax=Cucumis melo TaxID=3656 RepID=A0A9I9CJW5_CUCME